VIKLLHKYGSASFFVIFKLWTGFMHGIYQNGEN